ncbi:aspartyl-phosphate phosphatase Spo0E family protein [Paenibacillus barcinonensis]|uniref:Aspartyl-phosphate phosphatase Spo0E family protein n=1 Tax=Paenibacillus barcinonensis TaxID=198119 RepID=A0A2V4VQS7_PAEBA|nr:aspartyl-phosphate phosphatase Spo0E family protein [Paenibacillus barcinonensis]PYE48884.1 Spo0E like sporulation regulatory protein [Paenibacillus barcinonensis]QKS57702.1 aspartyl-phosphate phosphatase Spo0E family protein [Paenibacillus barcinonensis]
MERMELKSQIEEARQLLHQVHLQYGSLLHPEVIRQSVVLDALLNQYNRMCVEKWMN